VSQDASVITPWGLMPASMLRQAGPDEFVPYVPTATPQISGTAGYITDARWTASSSPITLMQATFVVPPPPSTSSTQLLYLFPGLQNSTPGGFIVQPILQWGNNRVFGGPYWLIANWKADGSGGAVTSSQITVTPGTVLTARVTFTGGTYNYTCSFVGYPSIDLNVSVPSLLDQTIVAFEAYDSTTAAVLTDCAQYPNTDFTEFSSIAVQVSGAAVTPAWTPRVYQSGCGQASVINSPSDISLYYRDAVSSVAGSSNWWSWGSPGGGSYAPSWLGRTCTNTTPAYTPDRMALPMLGAADFFQIWGYQSGAGAAITLASQILVWGDGTVPNYNSPTPYQTKWGQQIPWTPPVAGFPNGTPPSLCPPTKLTYPDAIGVQVVQTTGGTVWIKPDNTVWAVGKNVNGEFGIGEAAGTYHATPVQLTGLPPIQKIFGWDSAGTTNTMGGLFALDTSGRLWYAGNNTWGMDGGAFNTGNKLSWGLVAGLSGTVAELCVTNRAASGTTTNIGASAVALMADGTVVIWGRNLIGAASASLFAPSALSGVSNIKQIFASYPGGGTGTVFLLNSSGQLSGIGRDLNNLLLGGGDHYSLPPVALNIGGKTISRLMTAGWQTAAMFVVTTDAQLWGWGYTDYLFGQGSGAPPINSVVAPRVVYASYFNGLALEVSVMGELAIFCRTPAPVVAGTNQVSIVG
jgi:hypothetical protein